MGIFGYAINVFALLFVIFTSVFFMFPPFIPVTALSMNYVVVSHKKQRGLTATDHRAQGYVC